MWPLRSLRSVKYLMGKRCPSRTILKIVCSMAAHSSLQPFPLLPICICACAAGFCLARFCPSQPRPPPPSSKPPRVRFTVSGGVLIVLDKKAFMDEFRDAVRNNTSSLEVGQTCASVEPGELEAGMANFTLANAVNLPGTKHRIEWQGKPWASGSRVTVISSEAYGLYGAKPYVVFTVERPTKDVGRSCCT